MKTQRKRSNRGVPRSRAATRIAHEAEAAASGAIAGAVLGSGAGVPGAVTGAILGGLAGALAGVELEAESSRRAAHEQQLDEEIGVQGGDLGAPNLKHPPAIVGAFSAASAGAGGASAVPSEGPMPKPEK